MVQTDDHGNAVFTIAGGGTSSATFLGYVTADGVLLGRGLPIFSVDQDGDLDVDETDLAIAAAAESLYGAGRSDFNCNGVTDAADLDLIRAHMGHACASPPPGGPPLDSLVSGTWMRIAVSGQVLGRRGHSMIFDELHDQLIVFGGGNETQYKPPYFGFLNDVWELEFLPEPAWRFVSASGGPDPRLSHSAIHDSRRELMVVFGGRTTCAEGCVAGNDAWGLGFIGTEVWNDLAPAGDRPRGRDGALAVYDPLRDRMIVFAGAGYDCYFPYGCRARPLSDIWELRFTDPPSWQQLEPIGSGPGAGYFLGAYDARRDRLLVYDAASSSTYAMNLDGPPSWSRLTTATPPPPNFRAEDGRLVADPLRDRLVLMAGGDLFSLDFTQEPPVWTRLDPIGGPIRLLDGAAVAYDPIADRLLVFGGGFFDYQRYEPHYPTAVRALNFGKPLRRAAIDVRPGSAENVIPLGSPGTVAAVVFGSTELAVSQINVESVRLAGAPVRRKGNGEPMVALSDVDGDGAADAVLHFDTEALRLSPDDTQVILSGRTRDGAGFVGLDQVRAIRAGHGAARVGLATQPSSDETGRPELTLGPARAEGGGLRVSCSLPDPSPAALEVFDVGGRRVASTAFEGRGEHEVILRGGAPFRPGLYFVRLSHGGGTLMRRAVHLH